MIDVHFGYGFHPIGQGLFSTGDLQGNVAAQQFDWVFDCGTASPLRYLQKQIDAFTSRLGAKPIGLFCLSHFDKDHVNGARELLTSHRVDTLVMPYFPLVERMAIALVEPNLSEDYLSFLIDPAGYMYAAAGDNLGNIVFITGGGSTPEGPEAPVRLPDYPDDGNWDLHFPDTKVPDSPPSEDLHGVSDPGLWRAVRVFTHARPFAVGGVWEFMFYNEHIPDKKAEASREEVAKVIRTFRRQDGFFEGDKLIAQLKPLYKRVFGSSGLARNRISLIVYSGPFNRSDVSGFDLFGGLTIRGLGSLARPYVYYLRPPNAARFKISIGYFGDFPLTSLTRLNNVRNHFGKRRWSWLDVVQVPHHGSRHSWFKGASAEFEHRASLISAARLSRKHPSDEVLDDLDGRGVMLVNEIQGAHFVGHVRFG
jgi:hypothetical protein